MTDTDIDLEVGSAVPASRSEGTVTNASVNEGEKAAVRPRSQQFYRPRPRQPLEPSVDDVMAEYRAELARSLTEAHNSSALRLKGRAKRMENSVWESKSTPSTKTPSVGSRGGRTTFVTFNQTLEATEYLSDDARTPKETSPADQASRKRISFAADVESQKYPTFIDEEDYEEDHAVEDETSVGAIQMTRVRGDEPSRMSVASNSESSTKGAGEGHWRTRASSIRRLPFRSAESIAHMAKRASNATIGKFGRYLANQATASVYPHMSEVKIAKDAKLRASAISESTLRVNTINATVIGSQSLGEGKRATVVSVASIPTGSIAPLPDASVLNANRSRVNFSGFRMQDAAVTDVISRCVTPNNSEVDGDDEDFGTASILLQKRNTISSTKVASRRRSTAVSRLLPDEQWDARDTMIGMRVQPNYPVFETHGRRTWPIVVILFALIYLSIFIYLETDLGARYKDSMHAWLRLEFYKDICTDIRGEIWRNLSYQLLHLDTMHIGVNLFILLALGIPLERSNGHCYFFIVFQMGVLFAAGAVGVVFPTRFVIGASGGCYALFGAHISVIVLNWNTMVTRWCRLFAFTTLIVIEFVTNVVGEGNLKKVALEAHVGGLLVGFLIGIWSSTNLVESKKDVYLRVGSNILFWATAIFMIVYIAVAQGPPPCPANELNKQKQY